MNPEQYCIDLLKKNDAYFDISFLRLPHDKRRAITAIHALCQSLDDVVNTIDDKEIAAAKLKWWRGEISALFNDSPTHPITQALLPATKTFDLHEPQFLEILEGKVMDLDHQPYPDFKSLSLYCYRASGVVSLLSAQILGFTDKGTLKFANDIGIAIGLSNLIRDLGENALRGRIYLPVDEMIRFGVYSPDLLQLKGSAELTALLSFQAKRADSFYQSALKALPKSDHYRQKPALMMASLAMDLLSVMKKNGFDTLTQKYSLIRPRKAYCMLFAYCKTLPYLRYTQ